MKFAGYIDIINYDNCILTFEGWAWYLEENCLPSTIDVYIGDEKIFSSSEFTIQRNDVSDFLKTQNHVRGFAHSIYLLDFDYNLDFLYILATYENEKYVFDTFLNEPKKHDEKIFEDFSIKAKTFGENFNQLKNDNSMAINDSIQNNTSLAFIFPETITLVVTHKCNFSCITCSQDHKSSIELPESALEKLKIAFPFVKELLISGGEPLLYKPLPKFLVEAKKFGVTTAVTTNISLITKDNAPFWAKHIDRLVISIDGATEKTYRKIRRASLKKILRNISYMADCMKALGEEAAHKSIEFNFVAMRSNIDELPALIELAHQYSVNRVRVMYIQVPEKGLLHESLFFHKELSDKRIREAEDLAMRYGVALSRPTLFSEASEVELPSNPICTWPWNWLEVWPSGHMSICCGGAGTCGNDITIHTHGFFQCWHAQRRKKIRQLVNTARRHLLPFCMKCKVGTYCNPNERATHIGYQE